MVVSFNDAKARTYKGNNINTCKEGIVNTASRVFNSYSPRPQVAMNSVKVFCLYLLITRYRIDVNSFSYTIQWNLYITKSLV